jgi:hypothetical protein
MNLLVLAADPASICLASCAPEVAFDAEMLGGSSGNGNGGVSGEAEYAEAKRFARAVRAGAVMSNRSIAFER